MPSPQRDSFEHDTERIARYLHEDLQPSSIGVALFACPGADGLMSLQLDAIAAHRVYVAHRPHLYPLARLTD